MSIIVLIKIGIVFMFAAWVQSASGFGFSVFSVSVLLFFGLSLPQTVALVICGSAVQRITAIIYLRDSIDKKELFPVIITGLLSMPIGVYLMFTINKLHPSYVKMIIGFIIIFILALQWKGFIIPSNRVRKRWGIIAAFFSGILNGLANIGGSPIVLWILSHKWPNRKMRVTALAYSITFVPFQLVILYLIYRTIILKTVQYSFIYIPFILLGAFLGLKTGDKIERDLLHKLMQYLLLFIALFSIINGIL
jgi:uncharacterized membrane protein YfcA